MKTTRWHRDDEISAPYAIGAKLKWCINNTGCSTCDIKFIFAK